MSILNIFFNEFMPKCNNAVKTVDISILEKINLLSPAKIILKYSDAEESLRSADEVIIKKFALNFASEKTFPKAAIKAMEIVLLKDCGNDENNAQKTLLLHASKADADPSTVSDFFIRCSKMKIKRDKDDELEKWRTMSYKVLKNKHVNEIIPLTVSQGLTPENNVKNVCSKTSPL